MRPRSLLAFALLAGAALAQADPSDYGKVDTFQPGKKYNCVPTADHKGWDCKQIGNADSPPSSAAPAASAPPPRATPTPPPESAPAAAPRAGALPGYLAAPNPASAMQPLPAAPGPKPAPKPRVQGPMVPAQAPAAAANPPPAPPPQPATPVPEPAPVVTAPPPKLMPAPTMTVSTPPVDFLALPADSYVIELAHAATEAELTAPNVTSGNMYKLHLRQNDAEVWLLVCGPYDSLQAARTARADLAAQGATSGWPRRVGPLQTEVRRRQSF
ncbi:MAG: hypothetical protein JSR27_10755 [Proteobacteria bacterium]|nr:hypothetical protein [Pseudomonadota bacterium]